VYWHHFGLSTEPFSLTPDPAFLYMSDGHAEALAALKLGLLERRGLLAMIGEVGTGKTTLLYSLIGGLDAEIKTAYVSNTRLSFDGVLRNTLNDFGLQSPSKDRIDMLECLNDFLIECAEQDTTAALIIDEAQNLSPEVFEEIRLLSNFETYTTKLLQIVLVGQPELATKLNDRGLRQINERIAVRCHLNPLTEKQARQYIEHRIEAAGGQPELFSSRAIRKIIAQSRGIPRRINILAHNSLLFAYGRDVKSITHDIVADVIRDQEGAGLRRFDVPDEGEKAGFGETTLGAIDKAASSRLGLDRLPLAAWLAAGLVAGSVATWLLAPHTDKITAITGIRETAPVQYTPAAVRPPVAPAPRTQPQIEANDDLEAAATPAPAAQKATTAQPEAARPATAPESFELPVAVQARIEKALADLEAAAATAQRAASHAGEATAASNEPTAIAAPAAAPTAAPTVAPTVAPTDTPAADANDGADAVAAQSATSGVLELDEVAASDTPQILAIPAGGTLSGMMIDIYGDFNTDLLGAVRRANPHINNPNRIVAGERINFPDLPPAASNTSGGDSDE